MAQLLPRRLLDFVKPQADIDWSKSIPADRAFRPTPAIEANARYFDCPEWTDGYLRHCHRDAAFKARWTAATGAWDDKIVVDIGCGPGNVFATMGGVPKTLIGVDVSRGSLEIACESGYEPLLADAHDLPLASGIADIVVVNATLHHCDDMTRILQEAARLVAPGGVLVTDHDPQLEAWDFKGLGKWLWDQRIWIYRRLKIGFHASREQQAAALATEIHHTPGDGVTRQFFERVLRPRGFVVEVHGHNHGEGEEVLRGSWGKSATKYRVGQRLSFIDPDAEHAALSLMCVAKLPASRAVTLANCNGLDPGA